MLSYRTLKVLADLDPAVAEVTGFTRYGIDGDTITIVDRGGISQQIASRVDRNPALVGTKHRVASEREVLVATRPPRRAHVHLRARGQGRHVRPASRCCTCASTTGSTRPTMRGVLIGYDRRYDRLVDWVTETEGTFDDHLLGELPVDELLIEPISDTADHWRSPDELATSVVMIGIGVDVVEIERFRLALTRTPVDARAAVHAGRARRTSRRRPTRCRRWRRASRRARRS